jgi:hypothetical protein
MGTEAIGKSQGSSAVSNASAAFGNGVSLMSPDEIIAFVSKALGDIGDQLNDYKNMVQQRQEKARDLREISATLRDMASKGDLTHYDQEKYNKMMNLLAKYKDADPSLRAVYDKFMGGYGGYQKMDPQSGEYVKNDKGEVLCEGIMAGANEAGWKDMVNPDTGEPLINPFTGTAFQEWNPGDSQDLHMAAAELSPMLDDLKSAQEGLNEDNELTMMSLQQLMSRRQQLCQTATGMLNSVDDTSKSIIGNFG